MTKHGESSATFTIALLTPTVTSTTSVILIAMLITTSRSGITRLTTALFTTTSCSNLITTNTLNLYRRLPY